MPIYELKKNTRYFLQLLLKSESPITLDQLQAEMKVSRRTLYYVLEDVNQFFKYNNLESLSVDEGLYQYSTDQRRFIRSIFSQGDFSHVVLSSKERQYLILLHLLIDTYHFTVDSVISNLSISRSTFYEDIKQVETIISKNKCCLINEKRGHYYIEGTIHYRRSLLISVLRYLTNHMSLFNIWFVDTEMLTTTYNALMNLHVKYPIQHSGANLEIIAVLISFGYCEPEEKSMIPFQSKELKLIEAEFPQLTERETQFVFQLVYGYNPHNILGILKQQKDHLYTICDQLVTLFEQDNHLLFEDREQLIMLIYSHLRMNSYFVLDDYDEMKYKQMEEIKNKYNELYLKTIKCTKKLQNDYEPLSEETLVIGVMLHFGGFMRSNRFKRLADIVFVYVDDESILNDIMRWFNDNDSSVKVINMMDFSYMPENEALAKCIITNIPLNHEYKEIPIVYLDNKFSLDARIRIILILGQSANSLTDIETAVKTLLLVKGEMSSHQLEYYAKQLIKSDN